MTGSVVPAGASITRRFGAIMLEAAVFLFLYWLLSLVFPALGQGVELWQDPAPVLVLAAVRILGEAGWGTSPGKRLTGLMVVFSDRTGQTVTGSRGRLPLTVLRNGWLWLPPVMLLINPEHSWYNALASVVALTLLLRWDNRSLFDQLAGAEVLSATQTVSAPDPRQTPWPLASPAQRALAWLVDLAVAGVVGAVLLTVSGWNWWALTLVVLGTLRLLAEPACLLPALVQLPGDDLPPGGRAQPVGGAGGGAGGGVVVRTAAGRGGGDGVHPAHRRPP